MYQVIARKYRPQAFSELVGQEHVRTTLANAIAQNRIAHGYIFSGQRGTGKTTVARILARCLNCVNGPTGTPCGECASCLEISSGNTVDVIEIDAASNRGINEMRELRENVRYRPARDRHKVFIVDEAHQITSEAFNALLKTLEEPPEWVVFILCTTESHKIPMTIASRCQQFSFRSVDFEELVGRMQWICEQEGIQADPEVLSVLAYAGEGSVRDSLSALDQAIACCGGVLSAADVRRLLGTFSLDSLATVAEALKNSDRPAMLGIVGELERNGHNVQHFCRELARYFRNLLVVRIAGKGSRLVPASAEEQEQMARVAETFSEADLTRYLQITLELFKDLQTSLQPRLHVELGLLRLVEAGKLLPIEEAIALLASGAGSGGGAAKPSAAPRSASVISTPAQAPAAAPAPAAIRTGPSPFAQDTARKIPGPVSMGSVAATPAVAPAAPAAIADPNRADWRKMLHEALAEAGHTTTADAVEHSNIAFTGTELVFTTTRLYGMAVKGDTEIAPIVQRLAGRPVRITIKLGEAATPAAPLATAAPADGDLEQRALSHPEVQRFRELFPDAQVRDVRNLKD